MAGMRRGGAVASDWNSPRATRSGRMGTKVPANDTLASVEGSEKYSELLELQFFIRDSRYRRLVREQLEKSKSQLNPCECGLLVPLREGIESKTREKYR